MPFEPSDAQYALMLSLGVGYPLAGTDPCARGMGPKFSFPSLRTMIKTPTHRHICVANEEERITCGAFKGAKGRTIYNSPSRPHIQTCTPSPSPCPSPTPSYDSIYSSSSEDSPNRLRTPPVEGGWKEEEENATQRPLDIAPIRIVESGSNSPHSSIVSSVVYTALAGTPLKNAHMLTDVTMDWENTVTVDEMFAAYINVDACEL